MKKFKAKHDFSGYPQGAVEGSREHAYEKGKEYSGPDAYVDMIVGKGHATLVEEEKKEEPRVERAASPAKTEGETKKPASK